MVAIFGEGTGYVPCPDAEEGSVNDEGPAGRSTYFVAGPSSTMDCYFLVMQWGIDGLSWVGTFDENVAAAWHGPFFSRIFSSSDVLGHNFSQQALGGNTTDNHQRRYLGYITFIPTYDTLHFTGDLAIAPSWSGTFADEAAAILPDTPWELVVVYYDSDDLDAYTPYDAGDINAFDLTAYEQAVVASGTKSGDTDITDSIDVTFVRDSSKTETAFFLKNLATETVVVYDLGGGSHSTEVAPVLDPSPPHNTFAGTGGTSLTVSNVVIQACLVTPC
jgi:hypothetical protein